MKQEEIFALYDAMMTAEACGDYATASRLSKRYTDKTSLIIFCL